MRLWPFKRTLVYYFHAVKGSSLGVYTKTVTADR